MKKLYEIETRNQFADFLKIPRSLLTYVLYEKRVDNLYISFDIPKKSGEMRTINAPINELKDIQTRLANAISEYYLGVLKGRSINTNISHAFTKGKSIITNAEIHKNKRYILNIDLKNFFDSFHFGRVRGYFMKNSDFELSKEVATIIAQLTCYKGVLPQGAPTSPIITNLICNIMDFRLLKIAKKYKLDYTRYADDLTFSTNNKNFIEMYEVAIQEFKDVIERAGFKINETKTNFIYKSSRQVVTGLTVNEKISVSKEFCKNTRAMVDSLYKNQTFYIDGKEGTINQLEGRFAFIDQLDKYNNNKDTKSKHNWNTLNSRERQYQCFLFYKYFFNAEKPLIITEGKTDVLYLKAAMRNLNFKHGECVSFFKRSRRFRYFFDLQEDGADTLRNIYDMYVGKNKIPNYYERLVEKSGAQGTNPVIIVFDNELGKDKKPLYKFIQNLKGKNEDKIEELKTTYKTNIIGNLYVVTNPLVDGKPECEIEDLFDEETRAHKISGKKFSKSDKYNKATEYGKADFADYIYKNQRNINFERFMPMITAIEEIISEYNKNEDNI